MVFISEAFALLKILETGWKLIKGSDKLKKLNSKNNKYKSKSLRQSSLLHKTEQMDYQ